MGPELCISDQQQRGPDQVGHSGVHDLKYEALDPEEQGPDLYKFLEKYWQFWLEVQGEDLSMLEEYNVFGKIEKVPRIESYYYYRRNEGARVQLVWDRGEIVGFMLYYNIYNCILAIDAMWADKDHIARGLGKKMIQSLHKPIKRVLYQTRKKNPPQDMFKVVRKYSTLVHEKPDLLVWEMPWEVS